VSDFMDSIRKRTIKAISADVHESVLAKLREKARGMSLEEQMEMIVGEAMKTYTEPKSLKERNADGNQQPSTSHGVPEQRERDNLRSVQGKRYGKDAASGV
jgi:hypothetical protein